MKSFYMMLVAIAIMVVFALSLAASAVTKYIRYDPSAKHAVSETIQQGASPSAFVSADFGIGNNGRAANTHLLNQQDDALATADVTSAANSSTSDGDAVPSQSSLDTRLGANN